MLTSIVIKNLAIVSRLELDFNHGMTALTGETGAGKSILVDALGLALGNKADTGMIRAGQEKAEITLGFDISKIPEAREWLESMELAEADDCFLRRVLTQNHRSKAFINGSPVPLKSLQALGSLLVEIHGQHAHQRLLKNSFQLEILDQYADHATLCDTVRQQFNTWQATKKQLQELQSREQDRQSRLELLQFQASELQSLNLEKGETGQLENEFKKLDHAEQLIQGCHELGQQLYDDDDSLQNRISAAQHKLQQLAGISKELEDALPLLETALINIEECTETIRTTADSIEVDNQSLHEIEQRLQTIYDFSRKYRLQPDELCDKTRQITTELDTLLHADETLASLREKVEQQEKAYLDSARKLTDSRRKASQSLTQKTRELLHSLALGQAVFEIELTTLDIDKAGNKGLDQLEFKISANPGQPPGPISKIASGGELSRISLAIQVATLGRLQTPTLIFDEVDVGIGGGTAEIVGRLLRELGNSQQVLCVTHLPQVAAQAHHHMKVEKQHRDNDTTTGIHQLSEQDRITEIARMLGGIELTRNTLAHAEEMIQSV